MDATQFTTLFHAYGRATDTPGHLAALVGDDTVARSAALEHLWSAVIHQGTPWTATPPVAVAVAALVHDPRLTDADLRANLLGFLAAVAKAGRSADDLDDLAAPDGFDVDAALAAVLGTDAEDEIWADEVLGQALYARALLGCHAVVPTLLGAATSALSDPEPAVRTAAAHAVGACLAVSTEAAALAERLHALAATAGPDERAALVLAIGELGLDTSGYLDDPHPGVRACAALAPALADDPAATGEILAALADPAATDTWFTHRPPQLRTRTRFTLVAAAIARVDDPDRLLPVALAIAPIASRYTISEEWGPLLRALFAGRASGPLTEPQRRYLGALVANADLWDPSHGNARVLFRETGLPYDRATCETLAREPA
ncbi:hypothetical protein [Phytohabitans aurantiacus]|jgi:hypothetical protein|uniref:PBS lyase n=1 Tax=Phytohabitans aurantiacus TaxID=3016789 RepID=A0ABQ5QT75_9ACTN|nr:hypothetical protein [Phytohabitans aurantiacus]GLH96816.1 hypothetical protein Pa4123_20900 [Phytohabitans aurantiacus]